MFRWYTFYRCCFFLVFSFLFHTSELINVDLPSNIRYHVDEESMFGFTVAQYKQDSNSWILIGAPSATDDEFSTLDGNYKGGAVYYCDVTKLLECRSIEFFGQRNTEIWSYSEPDIPTRWLGATLVTSGSSQSGILICAPRYAHYSVNRKRSDYLPFGACYYSKRGFRKFVSFSPCIRDKFDRGVQEMGSCQSGFSAAMSKDSETLYIGAVGSYFWEGQIFSMDEVASSAYPPYWQTARFSFTQKSRSSIIPINQMDSLYLGFSSTSLNFYNIDSNGVATSQPRGNDLNGMVDVFTKDLLKIKSLFGEQMGSYFGYCICTVDVDGDKSDDLIIGAPMYSNHEKSLGNDYETGRVYIYYQGNMMCQELDYECGNMKFNKRDLIDGELPRGRFGFTVASLGDINLDGFGDFAVGAPYEDSSGTYERASSFTGAVYIYHGSGKGVVKTYAQVIRASDVYHVNKALTSLNTFGFSISGGLDLDGNLYPDLVVGAYESNSVYYFKSKPIIQLNANLSFVLENKIIELDKPNCNLEDRNLSCVGLMVCFQYKGIGVRDTFEISSTITLDVKKADLSRMFFVENHQRSIVERFVLHKNKESCKEWETYVLLRKSNMDKLAPMKALLEYQPATMHNRMKDKLPDVLDSKKPWRSDDSISISKGCGEDNICVPDLRLQIKCDESQHVLGSGFIHLEIGVQNYGENSFGSVFTLKLPRGVFYSQYYRRPVLSTDDSVIDCIPPTNDSLVVCHIGNPLREKEMVDFTIILQPDPITDTSEFKFWTKVGGSDAEDKNMSISIPIVEDNNLSIKNFSYPKTVNYDDHHYHYESAIDMGVHLKHEYFIENLGPSSISDFTVEFHWPQKLDTGEDLLYLISQPLTNGPIKCGEIETNYRHLNITWNSSGFHFPDKVPDPETDNSNDFTPKFNINGHYGFGYCNKTIDLELNSFCCDTSRTRFFTKDFNRCGTIAPGSGIWSNSLGGKMIYPTRKITSKKKVSPELKHFNMSSTNSRVSIGKITKKTDTQRKHRQTRSISFHDRDSNQFPNENDQSTDMKTSKNNHDVGIKTNKHLAQLDHSRNTNHSDKIIENGVCSSKKCIKIQCKVEQLLKNEQVSVLFPSIVWTKTIQKISTSKLTRVGSYVEINLTKPRRRARVTNTTFYSSEIITNIFWSKHKADSSTFQSMWIIIVATCLGVLILSTIVYGLYKFGFFVRNHPPKIPEQGMVDGTLQNGDL